MNIMKSSCPSFEEFTNRVENNLKKQGAELTEEQRVFIGEIWKHMSERAKRSSETVKTITSYTLSSGITAEKVAQNIEALVLKRKSLETTVAPYNERQIIELCLKKWKTEGCKEKAIERILEAYDTKSTTLIINGLKLTSLPAEIGRLSNLEHLDVHHNQLTSLPVEIGRLSNLRRLNVSINKLTSLPAEIGGLSNLEHLYVYHNQLTSLPAEIGGLSNLWGLNVSINKLTSLPAEIGRLSKLWRLDVSDNKLTSLPAEIGRLSNLEYLNVRDNKLTSLPAEVWRISNLWTLNVRDNKLTSLPAELGGLSNLECLDVSINKLTSLPAEIGRLSNLEYLYVNDNKLTSLPAAMGELRSLKELILYHNQNLIELPMNLGQIPGLTYISIYRTGISCAVVDSILNQCQSLRGADVVRTLPNRLETWKVTGKSEVDQFKVNALSEENKMTINEWLVRLERTREFSKAQAKLAALVCDMLKSVCENEGFRELFFAQVSANLECCGDRAAMALNEIYTSWLVTCQADHASLKHQLEIMTAVSKTLALRKALATLLQRRDQRESVETYLYYEKELSAKLSLNTAITHATFTGMGKRDWIDENRLVQTVNQAFFDELYELPIFQKVFKNKLLKEKKEINEQFQEELEEAEKKGSYLQTANALGKRRGEALKKLAKDWYEEQILFQK